ncbi:MAG: sensor histidine kinase, partial [Campylobacterota bacterium]
LHLTKDDLMKNMIETQVSGEDIILYGIQNEFKHLLLNLISNARDAFNEQDIKKRKLLFVLYEDDTYKRLSVTDNAGGIPLHIIDTIFKPNVTTKAQSEGTGTGLYLSSQIAYKHNGTLKVANKDGGASFVFEVDKRHLTGKNNIIQE